MDRSHSVNAIVILGFDHRNILPSVRKRLRTTALIAVPILIVADTFLASRRMYDNPSTKLLFGNAERPELAFLHSRQFDRQHYRLFPVDFDLGPITALTLDLPSPDDLPLSVVEHV